MNVEQIIKQITEYVSVEQMIYIAIAILALLLLIMIRTSMRNKKAKKMLNEYESRYHELKNIPLAFKVNKAVALAKVNPIASENVDFCVNAYDKISDKLKEVSVELASIDDLIYSHKVKQGMKRMKALNTSLTQLEDDVKQTNGLLDEILEREKEQRVSINELKDDFREVKSNVHDNENVYELTLEHLESTITKIENKFSVFEDYMFASEFNKASKQQDEIRVDIENLKLLVEVLPTLYEKINIVLTRMVDDLHDLHAHTKTKGVYLDHLQVYQNLDFISDRKKDCLNRLRNGQIEEVNEDFNECEKRITQLQQQIQMEDNAFNEIYKNKDKLFADIDNVNRDVNAIEQLYNRVYERFGFENWSTRLENVKVKLAKLNDLQRKLEKLLEEKNLPFSQLIIAYKELSQSVSMFYEDVLDMQEKLNNACSDEERAKKQLIKLQIALNESRVKMQKHRLPSVSNKYEADLHTGELMIKDIKVILDNSPLDVKRMNDELAKAIDFIYALYNNVNNLVGIAVMVEKTIVFGNRYRSSYPDIDSELTRADLCFRNGQYTKALKIFIQCIEKMHPGSYEKLLAKHEEGLLEEA